MGELVGTWAPYVVGVLVALGAFGWLREKLLGMRLVRTLHAESLVEVLADRLVTWAEKYSARLGDISGRAKMDAVKRRMSERLAQAGCRASDAELEEAIEAAHTRMTEAANFPEAAASSSGSASGAGSSRS